MKITIKDVKKTKKKISITVPAHFVEEEFKKTYAELGKKINLKGFRKGKVPAHILDQHCKEEIKHETLEHLVQLGFGKALEDHKLHMLGHPHFDFGTLENKKEFSFEASIEVKPEFTLKDYFAIPLKKKSPKITEKDIMAELEKIQKSRAELKPVAEGIAIAKDLVANIDFDGTIAGQPFEGGSSKNYTFDFGEGHFLKDFEKQMEGMQKTEERTIAVTFPEDYFQEELRNKAAEFKIKLNAIYSKLLPDIDDEFAKDLAKTDLAQLKKECQEMLSMRAESGIRAQYIEEIVDHLVSKNKMELPEHFLEHEIERTKASENDVSKSLQLQFIIEEIVIKEQIKLEPQDIEQRFQALAQQYRQPVQQIKKYFQEKNLFPQLIGQMVSEKTLDLLLEKAQIK